MTLDEALEIVKNRYGLGEIYVDARNGKMMHVVKTEEEVRAMGAVKMPECGIALLAPEVKELACGAITIDALVEKKHPELFP